MFTTVILHSCVLGDTTKPVVLDMTPSYPAPAYYPQDKARQVPKSWARKRPSLSEGLLEVTVLDRISEGRIGVVYNARVDKAIQGGCDITPSLPATVCLKFTKQHHCRSLAREAWFYEQLHQWQGVSIPTFYGFYTSTVQDQALSMDSFLPWSNLRTPSKLDSGLADNPELAEKYRSMDVLWDDMPRMFSVFSRSKYMKTSRWFEWNLDEENPNIGLIIMEKLGQPCINVWQPDESGDAFKTDIEAVLEDVAENGLVHGDVTVWNLLQYDGPEVDKQCCPRHGVMHQWRLIDFDRAVMVDLTNTGSGGKYALKGDRKCVGNPLGFWGPQDSF